MSDIPRTIRSKDPELEKLFNKILAKLNAVKPISTPTIRASETANGTMLDAIAQSTGNFEVVGCDRATGDSHTYVVSGYMKPDPDEEE